MIRQLRLLVFTGCVLALAAGAQTPVSLNINAKEDGCRIPADFSGVSIFTGTQVRDHKGVPGNLFSGTNYQLITLFTNTGLRHLRLGATGSATSSAKNLNHEDIDALFAFAKATDIKVIYSLHYADGPATAKYVWDNYRQYVDCFAFDNEPDNRLGEGGSGAASHPDYFSTWREFAKAVVQAVPGAKFAGPDAAGRTLVPRFLKEEKDSSPLAMITQHTYIGGNPRKKGIDLPHAVENMLSRGWLMTNYTQLYKGVLQPVQKQGLPFRITELDDHVHGVTNASDAFVSALWALDCMHWWAAHGAQGVNFQNTEWLRTDTFYPDSEGNYQVRPKACAIRAFDLGSHGRVKPVRINNPGDLNLTGYAVSDEANLYVTIVNKEHGAKGRDAAVRMIADGFAPMSAGVMFLEAANGGVLATNGVTIGGAPILNNTAWAGKWKSVPASKAGTSILVPAASAAVVKLSLAN